MIGLIGINHHTASVDQRECYALSREEADRLVKSCSTEGLLLGAIVLSTCNRIEIYFESNLSPLPFDRLKAILSQLKGVEEQTPSIFIERNGRAAIEHLFRLASGLESMVMGETQILGQLKDAYRDAVEADCSTSVLSRLFHKSFETAKKIRSQYLLSAVPISSGGAAVSFMDQQVGDRSLSTLIVGAGQIAETIYEALRRMGYSNIKLYNRTRDRAIRFSERHGAIPYYCEDELLEAIAQSRLIYVATSSLKPVITRRELEDVEGETLWLFDMAVPRNISEEVSSLPNVQLFTIDDLKEKSDEHLPELDWEGVEATLGEMVEQFVAWLDASYAREVIGQIWQATESVLGRELSLLPKQLNEVERELLSSYLKHLHTSYATAIIAAMREVTEEGKDLKRIEVIHSLFSKILEMDR